MFLFAMHLMSAPPVAEAGATGVPAEVVVVRAERLPPDRAMPAQIVLQASDLQAGGGQRLDEVFRDLPGVGLFRRTASPVANATIQGLSLRPIAPNGAGRALISLDGVPQNDPFGSWVFWVRHDPLFLDQVDVRRGAAGAGFGPLALTGTLDLYEARGGPTRVRLGGGGQGAAQIAARTGLQIGPAEVTMMASHEVGDGLIPVQPSQRGAIDRPVDLSATTWTLVGEMPAEAGLWSWRLSGFEEAKGAGTVGAASRAEGFDISAARSFAGDWGRGRIILFSQDRDFANQTVSVSPDRASVVPALDQFETPASALGGSVVLGLDLEGRAQRWTLDWRRSEGETRELFRFQSGAFTRLRVAGGQQDLIGVGLDVPRLLRTPDGAIGLDASVRLDHWANRDAMRLETDRVTGLVTLAERPSARDGQVWTGRLSAYGRDGWVRLSLYRTFRPPSLNELHRPFRVGNDVTEANADLVPEVLDGLDLDLRHQWQSAVWPLSGRVSADLSLYLNRLSDPITNVTIGTGPGLLPRVGFLPAGGTLRQRQNAGRIDAAGLEAGLNWVGDGPASPRLEARISLVDSQVKGGAKLPALTGLRPSQSAPWSSYLGLEISPVRDVRLGLGVRGEGPRFEDDLNTRKLKSFQALDARLTWILKPDVELSVRGENLTRSLIATTVTGAGIISATDEPIWRISVTITR